MTSQHTGLGLGEEVGFMLTDVGCNGRCHVLLIVIQKFITEFVHRLLLLIQRHELLFVEVGFEFLTVTVVFMPSAQR